MLLFTALAPILLVLILLFFFKISTAMAFALLSCVTLALVFWQMPWLQVAAAVVEGVIIASSVLWIMAGAMLLLAYQQQTGQLDKIRQGFAKLSPDPRLQLLWVGWFGVAFMEGIAGFGTPAAIIAPLLITLGFHPMAAVVLTLIADSAPVSYGALGTPLLIGVAQGASLADAELQGVAQQLAWLDLFAAPLLPIMMLVIYCQVFDRELTIRPALPHAIVAGIGYSVSALLWLQCFGAEFPAILAAMSGFACSYAYHAYRPLPAQSCSQPRPHLTITATEPVTNAEFTRAMMPYVLVIFCLLISRLPELPFKQLLQSWQISFQNILGTEISTTLSPLYLPGSIFILVVLLCLTKHDQPSQLWRRCWQDCFPKLRGAALTLCCAIPLVRLFVHSDVNALSLPAMPIYLANLAGQHIAEHWIFFSALLGALGAFIAGSATFSNLLFAQMQLDLAHQAALSPTLVMALQMLGANAGNMICLLNIVAAASVAGLQGQEQKLLKYLIGPMLLYVTVATFIASGWVLAISSQ